MVGKSVCVTGGSGFIASLLIKSLLQRGYTVNATVRYPHDPNKTHHLLSLDGAKERLHLFKADLLEEGSFDASVEGCDAVFHTASPFFLETTNPEEELIEPAVKGTLNVLGSVAKTPSVKRVVLTSSEAAMAFNRNPRGSDAVVNETWWSDVDYCRENKLWYVLSKTLAEKAAWDFAKEKNIDLISINPCCVIGPMLQPELKTSCGQINYLISGAETYWNNAYGWVHVNDVIDAHILAYETPEASGRYYVVERCCNPLGIINLLRKIYPNLKYPEKCSDDKPLAESYQVDASRVQKLGVKITPLEQALKETVECLKEKGLFTGELN